MSSLNEDTVEFLLAQLRSEFEETQRLRALQAAINRIGRLIQFVNQTAFPIQVLRPPAELSVPSELVGTIGRGQSLVVSASDGNHFVFCSLNTRQSMLFTSESDPDLSGFNLKLDEIDGVVVGLNLFFITVPSEVATLKDACVESVLTSVGRSVAKIDQLPLSKPVIMQLKDAAEDPSDYFLAKESIVRYNNSAIIAKELFTCV